MIYSVKFLYEIGEKSITLKKFIWKMWLRTSDKNRRKEKRNVYVKVL